MFAIVCAVTALLGLGSGGYLGYRWGRTVETKAKAALDLLSH